MFFLFHVGLFAGSSREFSGFLGFFLFGPHFLSSDLVQQGISLTSPSSQCLKGLQLRRCPYGHLGFTWVSWTNVFFFGRRPLLQNHLMEQNVKGFGSKDICSILFVGFITFRIPHIPLLVTPNLATHMNYLAAQREDLFHQDNSSLVGGFKYFYFFISTLLGEMIQFD